MKNDKNDLTISESLPNMSLFVKQLQPQKIERLYLEVQAHRSYAAFPLVKHPVQAMKELLEILFFKTKKSNWFIIICNLPRKKKNASKK